MTGTLIKNDISAGLVITNVSIDYFEREKQLFSKNLFVLTFPA